MNATENLGFHQGRVMTQQMACGWGWRDDDNEDDDDKYDSGNDDGDTGNDDGDTGKNEYNEWWCMKNDTECK